MAVAVLSAIIERPEPTLEHDLRLFDRMFGLHDRLDHRP